MPAKDRQQRLESQKRSMHALKSLRRKQHVCTDCGQPCDVLKRCTECHKRALETGKRIRDGHVILGLCRQCGVAAVAGQLCLKHWYHRMGRRSGLKPAESEQILSTLWATQCGKCVYTGIELHPGVNASLDHKVPKSAGGRTDMSNLQWVTDAVNIAKATLSEDDFLSLCETVVQHRARLLQAWFITKPVVPARSSDESQATTS